MGCSVYIFAVSGKSPAVVLELIWWLSVVEQRHIAGIEVWTTGEFEDAFRRLIGRVWDDFQAATTNLPHLEPKGEPGLPAGFHVHVLKNEHGPLADIRSHSESTCVSARLNDRLRELRDQLSSRVTLIGSLAGGRKTLSAALQTAFCLQARKQDRLVHVLLDARLEHWLWDHRQMSQYDYPSTHWEEASGVPVLDQVLVYDVPFPRLRYLVPHRLIAALDEPSWEKVWPVLEGNLHTPTHGVLTRRGDRWVYTIYDDANDVVYQANLPGRPGSILAAGACLKDSPSASDVVEWLDRHPSLWAPSAVDYDAREARVRAAAKDLRKALADIPPGLENYCPKSTGYQIEANVTLQPGALAGLPAVSLTKAVQTLTTPPRMGGLKGPKE